MSASEQFASASISLTCIVAVHASMKSVDYALCANKIMSTSKVASAVNPRLIVKLIMKCLLLAHANSVN